MKRFLFSALLALGFAISAQAQIELPVNTALSEILVNKVQLTDDTDFKTRETSVAYNAGGLDLTWNFTTKAGAFTQTAVTPTDTGGNYDWVNQGDGFYTIEIPASGGATINNNAEGCGFFAGFATGVLPWIGPTYCFVQVAERVEVIAHGTAQSATGTTIVLASASSFANDELNGNLISIVGGTGKGQTRIIDDYAGSSDTVTVTNWTTTPDSTSVYEITPFPTLLTKAQIQTGLLYLPKNTATSGDRIHFTPYRNGNPTKNASSVSCQISLDGAAAAALTDTPTEVEFSTGSYWKFDLTQAETNGAAAEIMCTGTAMDPAPIRVEFQQ